MDIFYGRSLWRLCSNSNRLGENIILSSIIIRKANCFLKKIEQNIRTSVKAKNKHEFTEQLLWLGNADLTKKVDSESVSSKETFSFNFKYKWKCICIKFNISLKNKTIIIFTKANHYLILACIISKNDQIYFKYIAVWRQ